MVDSIFNLKRIPRKVFKKHFLNQVHCEVRFEGNVKSKIIQEKEWLTELFERLGFESVRPLMMGKLSFKMGEKGEIPSMENDSSQIGFTFKSQNPKKEIQISGDKILFSDYSYEGFEKFSEQFYSIILEVSKRISFVMVNKVGFRKINSIKIAPVNSLHDACMIFSPNIFKTVRSGLIVDDSLKLNEERILLEKGNNVCLAQFRIKKVQEQASYEAHLDFDIISKNVTDIETVFNKSLPEINCAHFDLFMWAVTEDLIKLMEAK